MVQVFICPMYKLSATSREFKLILVSRNPVLASFILNKTCVRNIIEPYLHQKQKTYIHENLNKRVCEVTFVLLTLFSYQN